MIYKLKACLVKCMELIKIYWYMEKKAIIAYTSLALRILTLVSLALPFAISKNIGRYWFFIAVIATAYTLLQIAFAIYYACRGKRFFGCLPDFDFTETKSSNLLVTFLMCPSLSLSLSFTHNFCYVLLTKF